MALRRKRRGTKKRRVTKRRRSSARRGARKELSASQVRRFARKYGVTGKVVKRTVRKVGTSKTRIEAALKRM
jgi:hypothetical protein